MVPAFSAVIGFFTWFTEISNVAQVRSMLAQVGLGINIDGLLVFGLLVGLGTMSLGISIAFGVIGAQAKLCGSIAKPWFQLASAFLVIGGVLFARALW